MNYLKSIFLIFYILLISISCQQIKGQKYKAKELSKDSYIPTMLPKDTTKLWITDGNNQNDTVTIFCQGGPSNDLAFETNGKTQWRYLPNYKEHYFRIHLHQSNTFNPKIFLYDGEFTMDMARKEVDNSSEILYRAIQYFKERNKTVYVFGHSYGAFIIPHYLATRPSLADRYIIVSGRIDDPKEVVQFHKDGLNGTYENGQKFIPEVEKDFSAYSQKEIKYYLAKQKLKAAIGELSYSKALKDIDLSKSIYIYNPTDERVGGLTNEELDFLKSKGFQIYKTKHPHGDTVYGLIDAIQEGIIKL